MKQVIRLTESDLHRIVKKSVNKVLKESFNANQFILAFNGKEEVIDVDMSQIQFMIELLSKVDNLLGGHIEVYAK